MVEIVEVIVGGPVWKAKALEVGDLILKVAQKDEDAVEIGPMRLSDDKLIKGPKGTQVFLTVKRVSGVIEEIVINRDVVELEESYAKSSIIQKNGKNYGFIQLPKFYIDFKDQNSENAADIIKKELQALKKRNVSGIILDLRNNGGGSLKTVVDITKVFINKGPVVQVKTPVVPKMYYLTKTHPLFGMVHWLLWSINFPHQHPKFWQLHCKIIKGLSFWEVNKLLVKEQFKM